VIYGYAGDDSIGGSDGNDSIIGGAGADTMVGGLGTDTFEVTDVTNIGSDEIHYFTTAADAAAIGLGADQIEFSDTDLTGLAAWVAYAGTSTSVVTLHDGVTTAAFVTGAGAVATEAYATFAFDTSTGVLTFDADGTGVTASAITVATLYSDAGSTVIADFTSSDLTFIA